MSSQDPQQHPTAGQETGAAANLPILGLIESVQLACRADMPVQEFVTEVLRAFVALADAHYGAFWRADRNSGNVAPAAELMPRVSTQAARGWAPALTELAAGVIEQSIIRYQAVSEPAGQLLTGQRYVALGVPLRGDESVAGCVTVVVRQDSRILSDAGVAMLRLLADLGILYSKTRTAAHFEGSYRSLSSAWDVIGEALAFTRPQEMAQVLADRARAAFGAERVSVGFVDGDQITVAAISGEDTLDKRSNIVKQIQAAHTEVLVSGEPGLYDVSEDVERRAAQLTRNPQHEQLARDSGAHAVYSVPLRKGDDIVGVWALEFGSGTPVTTDLRQVIDVTAGQLGPVVDLARQNDRDILRRAGDDLASGVKWLVGKEHPWRKVAAAAVLGVFLVAVFGRTAFNVTGNCRLVPSFRRVYTAPFDTTISATPVRPGDPVAAGQTIVEFDTEDLELRLREAQSNLTSYEKQMSTCLAQQKMSQYAEARARRDALAAEIERLGRNIARAKVQAEAPGMVITGDLTQDIGRPVRMGEQLIEVAPLDELVLEVEVDQGDVGFVKAGQEGRFTTKARPNDSLPFTVTNIRPTPEVRGGASVYVAEAVVENKDGWLRPGMEGAAKVEVERRNILWVVTRKLVNWLRLHIWW